MVSAIVLAAGISSRMEGGAKLLLPLCGKAIVQRVTANILAAGVAEVIIVTGHEAGRVAGLLQSMPVQFIHNPDYAQGMTSSIQKGVAIATGDGYMICLSDMPFITGADYAALAHFFETTNAVSAACICIPTCNGKAGNPVVFSSSYREEILRHPDPTGCKGIVQHHAGAVYHCEMGGDAILKDIDNAEDYRLARAVQADAF